MIALLLAGGIALAISLVGTRFLIGWLARHGIGQPIHEYAPEGHRVKAGTPTMGGVGIVAAAVVGYLAAHVRSGLVFTRTGVLVILCIAGAGAVGAMDDWIKVSQERNLGLSKRAKMAGLLVVAVAFAVATVAWTDVETTLSFTRWNSPGLEMGKPLWCVWAVLLILASTNAVNLTDGLDGLAAGSSMYAFIAFTVIGFWSFRHFDIYRINHSLDLAVVAAAMLGAITGFLWWNAAPARIIMGDTGALAIGAGLASLALVLNVQLLLPILGGLFVFETMSVILQVGIFRLFGGRRLFRTAPVHHHFEIGGWPETTVIIRFWILSGVCTAFALGLYYADYISIPGTTD